MRKVILAMILLIMLTATVSAETGPEMIPTDVGFSFRGVSFVDMEDVETGRHAGVRIFGEAIDETSNIYVNFHGEKEGEERRKETTFIITLYDESSRVIGFSVFFIKSTKGDIRPFYVSLIPFIKAVDIKSYRIEADGWRIDR